MGKSEAIHLLGLPLNHSLEDLAGIISDIQHGTKTTIPDSHHSKTHRHWKNRQSVFKSDDTEKTTPSTTYVRLMETIYKDWYPANILTLSFTHNVKCEGEIASRGASFRFGYEDETPTWYPIVIMRWTDGLDDYKMMSGSFVFGVGGPATCRFVVDWLVDNASYPCWSKNRYMHVQSFQQGGDYLSDT